MSFLSLSNVASAVGVTASLIWIGQFARIFANRRKAVRLRGLTDDEPKAGWPSLAVIVAARDEDANVERSVRSLLAQDYPALEIIAVDDRSSDRTGTILDSLAREDGRLQVVHVTDLPAGWLGKTNAMISSAG